MLTALVLAAALLPRPAAGAAAPDLFYGPLPPGFKFSRADARAEAPRPEDWQATIDDAAPAPLTWDGKPGPVVARMALGPQLDRHRALARLQLGSRAWDVGLAGDAAFRRYYITFARGIQTRVAPLGDLNRLRGDGIEVEIEPGVVYRFKLQLSWVNPVRGSTLSARPSRGTSGPAHALNTGDLVDAVRALSFVFRVDGDEYWTLYGTDIEPATGLPGGTHSLLFLRFAGLSTKAWSLGEAALPPSQATRVQLLTPLVLTRDASTVTIAR